MRALLLLSVVALASFSRHLCFGAEDPEASSEEESKPCVGACRLPLQVPRPKTSPQTTATPFCVEKIDKPEYVVLTHFPNSQRALIGTQGGLIKAVTIPADGARGAIPAGTTFLDLRRLLSWFKPGSVPGSPVGPQFEDGIAAVAFHPNYATNGKFYVSFLCQAWKFPECRPKPYYCPCNQFKCTASCQKTCGGNCSATTCANAGCNPLPTPSTSTCPGPCSVSFVISEYTAIGPNFMAATAAQPKETRRIFTYYRTCAGNDNGLPILFDRPAAQNGHAYLLIVVRDGGDPGSKPNYAQDPRLVQGKVLRVDVDAPAPSGIFKNFMLHGSYGIPPGNPFINTPGVRPEIYAMGIRNPWQLRYDRVTNRLFMGDVGQKTWEEVDELIKGHNYGWPTFEGNARTNFPFKLGGTYTLSNVGVLHPAEIVYNHNLQQEVAVIFGGVYRGGFYPCHAGRLLYCDHSEAHGCWVAAIQPPGSKAYRALRVSYQCARDSALPCCDTPPCGKNVTQEEHLAFAESPSGEIYFITSKGVFRTVSPSRCGITCV